MNVNDSIEPLNDKEIEMVRRWEPRLVATIDELKATAERARESYENNVARQHDMKKKLRDVGVVFSLGGLPINLYAHTTAELPELEPVDADQFKVTSEPRLPDWMKVCLFLLAVLGVCGIVVAVLAVAEVLGR